MSKTLFAAVFAALVFLSACGDNGLNLPFSPSSFTAAAVSGQSEGVNNDTGQKNTAKKNAQNEKKANDASQSIPARPQPVVFLPLAKARE